MLYMLNTFYHQMTHTTLKSVELLKHSKIDKNAATCFGLHGNHLQGAKVSTPAGVHTTWPYATCLTQYTLTQCTIHSARYTRRYRVSPILYIFYPVFVFIILNYHLHIPYISFITVTICSHSNDDALHIFHASTLNQKCKFNQVLTLAPWRWFPCRPKHVGAFLSILECFNSYVF